MREDCIDALDGFAEAPPVQGSSTAPGIVRDDDRETLVQRPGPERCLAKARVAEQGYPLGVDVVVAFQMTLDQLILIPLLTGQ